MTQAAPPRTDALVRRTRPFAAPNVWRSVFQVVSTVALLGGALFALPWVPWPGRLLAIPLLAGLIIRAFVLDHDCGHGALFPTRAANDAVGRWLGYVSGIAYEAWRAEHNWHHAHQGKLADRGFDHYSSPMTVDEALADPAAAAARIQRVRWATILGIGPVSLLVQRKHFSGWIYSRTGWRWALDRPRVVRGLVRTGVAHGGLHAAVILYAGWASWGLVFVPALLLAGAVGSLLFWVQHNHAKSYWAPDETWSFERVALEGSSYLKLPWPLSWFTAHIGLHHVHHLDVRVPNYRLEEARRALPALAAVAPIGWRDVTGSFRRIFWSPRHARYVSPEELALADASPDARMTGAAS